jgi:hypothetical protein
MQSLSQEEIARLGIKQLGSVDRLANAVNVPARTLLRCAAGRHTLSADEEARLRSVVLPTLATRGEQNRDTTSVE